MKALLYIISCLIVASVDAQTQACPANINYSDNNFNHWFAFTGDWSTGSSRSPKNMINYDTSSPAPTGTMNATMIPEYNLSTPGIEVLTSPGQDPFGGFQTIPTINGYTYNYSMKIGSTATSSADGGLFRGLGYTFDVPPGSPSDPYVITYAYAMVLESAPHVNDQVPMFTATLNTASGTIDCANATYLLPTLPTGGGGNNAFSLDVAAALRLGFSQSNTPSPNPINNQNPYRVWTKGWTEVIFDLAAYRGQKVTLTFQADNCVPKGHFAYAYVALRNKCDGMQISGDPIACTNSNLNYIIPELAGGTYQWTIPSGWTMINDSLNVITVKPGTKGGLIIAKATNSCASLIDTLKVSTSTPTVAGSLKGNISFCMAIDSTKSFPITLTGNTGSVLNWLSSNDFGASWNNIADTGTNIIVKNIKTTTWYKAMVQNGPACSIDSSTTAIIGVDQKTVAGVYAPDTVQVCKGQNRAASLELKGYTGSILNWQSSLDQISWKNFNPAKQDAIFDIQGVTVPTRFRAIVKNGTCPADTSATALVATYNAFYPQASLFPKDTSICLGTVALLNANISIGTSFAWTNPNGIFNAGSGIINATPFGIRAKTAPSKNTDYILNIQNAGCPNIFTDTFHIRVMPALSVFAGKDSSVIAGQPVQLHASINNAAEPLTYSWSPTTGLDDPRSASPISILGIGQQKIRYIVSVKDSAGCAASDDILLQVFDTGPEIFIPSAFTPNDDGRNDLLKPIPVGVSKLNYFMVYNRWGQLLYSTNEFGKGWDGRLQGVLQASGTYVYTAEAIDFEGNKIFKKGTVVLIR